jgi:hypothetical protein
MHIANLIFTNKAYPDLLFCNEPDPFDLFILIW